MLTSYKLIFAVGFVGFLVISGFSFMSTKSYEKELTSQIENHANQLSETIKRSTKYEMLLNRRESIYKIIDTIGEQAGIEKVRIINKIGEIIFSSDRKEINNMIDKKTEACYICHAADKPLEKLPNKERTRIFFGNNNIRNLGIINPIYNEVTCWKSDCHFHKKENTVLGVLDIVMSLENVDKQIISYQKKMIIFAFFAIVVNCFFMWLIIHRIIGKPVKEFLNATGAVAKGDFNYKVVMDKKHEFRNLADSFNIMTDKLSETQNQLYHNAKLASIGQLAAGVAHEINNPLTGVLTFSSYHLKRIENNKLDVDDLKESLEVIVRETKRCREIVKSLLDFSRQVPPKKMNINFIEVVDQALSILDNQFILNKISVIKNFNENIPIIRGDRNQFQQILMNLLVNAIHAIGDGGGKITINVNVASTEGEKYIEVKVTDSGCGISKEKLSMIFEPFYSTKGQKGTGLGLSVAWGIIDEHNGKISVESELGDGTTFTIQLPVNNNTSTILN